MLLDEPEEENSFDEIKQNLKVTCAILLVITIVIIILMLLVAWLLLSWLTSDMIDIAN